MSSTSDLDRAEVADRIAAAYAIVARWGAHEFKRRPSSSGLTATQLAILVMTEKTGGTTVSHLADRLELTVPTVVRAVDALERKQLIARQRSAEDRREVRIASTPEGVQTRKELEEQRRRRVLRLLQDMTDDEVLALLTGYEAMARVAMEQPREEAVV